MRVEGVGRLTRKLEASTGRVERRAKEALGDVGEDLKTRSQAVAPYRPAAESDHLRDHAFADVSRGRGGPELEVGYEGPEGYLLVQHYGGWLNHMGYRGPVDIEHYTTPGTGPFFLERPWLENKPRYVRELEEAARKAVRGDAAR